MKLLDSGAVIWEGRSLLDPSAPIAVILTGFKWSSNRKTGPMVQAHVIRTDMNPSEAIKGGHDSAICGNCAHRSGSNIGRSCYVVWWQSPFNVYKALDRYPRQTVEQLRPTIANRYVRITSYGDAAAVPSALWFELAGTAYGWTGYTSQWRTCDSRLKTILMASVTTDLEKEDANGMGWRTFRTRRTGDWLHDDHLQLFKNEIICPASAEAEYRTTCEQCRLCRGTEVGGKSIAILPHGQRVKWLTPVG